MGDLLNQREAAEYMGVTKRRIRALEKDEKKFSRNADGLYDTDDLDKAKGNFDPNRVAANRMGRAKPDDLVKRAAPEEKADTSDVDAQNHLFLKARTARAVADAKSADLKYKQQAGLLVDAALAKATSFDIAKRVQQKLKNFEARLGPYMDTEGKRMLKKEIRAVCEEMIEDIAKI